MVADGGVDRARTGVADRLRTGTRELHARAESAGVVRDLIAGTASRDAYLCYLRNLHPVYECLEDAVEARGEEPRWRTLANPAVHRTGALAADLAAIGGSDWRERWPVVAAGKRYRARIQAAARESSGARLAAHAYTRYLGDLSGGRVLGRVVARSLGLPPEHLRTYRFDGVPNLARLKASYRQAFDDWADFEAELLDETAAAFELNIALAEEIAAVSRNRRLA